MSLVTACESTASVAGGLRNGDGRQVRTRGLSALLNLAGRSGLVSLPASTPGLLSRLLSVSLQTNPPVHVGRREVRVQV